MNQHNFPPKPK
jgi:hypothetical protein